MGTRKVIVFMQQSLLARIDRLVSKGVFENRSQAIEAAVREKVTRTEAGRLARECARLDPVFEQAMAEEGFSGEVNEWPRY